MSNYLVKQMNKGRMTNDLPIMPIVATENQQSSKARICPMRSYAALGTYAKRSNLPEAPASTGIGDAGEGEVVCQGGQGVKV